MPRVADASGRWEHLSSGHRTGAVCPVGGGGCPSSQGDGLSRCPEWGTWQAGDAHLTSTPQLVQSCTTQQELEARELRVSCLLVNGDLRTHLIKVTRYMGRLWIQRLGGFLSFPIMKICTHRPSSVCPPPRSTIHSVMGDRWTVPSQLDLGPSRAGFGWDSRLPHLGSQKPSPVGFPPLGLRLQ